MPPALAVSEKATVDCVTTIEVLRAHIARLESAAPVVREPLTQDQIVGLAENYEERYHRWVFICVDELEQFARAIERAHGIGGGGK